MPRLTVAAFSVGWKESPKPSVEPGSWGSDLVLAETPDLSAAKPLTPRRSAKIAKPKSRGARQRPALLGALPQQALEPLIWFAKSPPATRLSP